jgi:hypothetical protein
MRFSLFLFMLLSFSIFANNDTKTTEPDLEHEMEFVQNRLNLIEQLVYKNNSEIQGLTTTAKNNALALVLFAFFCAWWAKSTGRNTIVWFFLGLVFHIFTAIVLVAKTKPKSSL